MSLGISVNRNRNGLLLAHIANGIPDIHLRKLLKIIYLMDEHFMKMRGFPLTWFDYFAWAKGPVAPEVYGIKDGAFDDFAISHISKNDKRVVNSILSEPEVNSSMQNLFSDGEIAGIDRLIDEYRNLSADKLSNPTNVSDSVWSKVVAENRLAFDADNTKSDCRVDLKLLFGVNDSRMAIYEDARWSLELQASLNSTANPNHRIKLKVVTPSEREQYNIPVYTPAIP